MYGYQGKILKVNLSTKKYFIVKLSSSKYKKYLGGRGLAGFFLKNKMHLSCDDEKLPVVIFTGPLTACGVEGASRLTIMSKSPLTNGVGDNSSQGGFASMLKKSGFDGIIITGKSSCLTGIEISDSKLVFKNAEDHRGVAVPKQFKMLKGKGSIALTGYGADNMVRFSNIYLDGGFTSSYAGLGLNWSYKNLKYITVKGSSDLKIFDLDKLLNSNNDIIRLMNASPFLNGEFGISRFSSGALLDLCYARNLLPVKHFKDSRHSNPLSFNAPSLLKKKRHDSLKECSCFLECKKKIDKETLMPEFEELAALSSFSDKISKNTILKAYKICFEAGIDVISSVGVILTYQKVTSKRISQTSFLSLLAKISKGMQEGVFLKEGAYLYAKSQGKEEFSMTVNKVSIPPIDPRGGYCTALSYSTSTIGASYTRAFPLMYEILRKPVAFNRFSFTGAARIVKIFEDVFSVSDSLGICPFIIFSVTIEELAKSYNSITGFKFKALDLLQKGALIYKQEINLNKEVFKKKSADVLIEDKLTLKDINTLPDYFFKNKTSRLPVINKRKYLKSLREYIVIRSDS